MKDFGNFRALVEQTIDLQQAELRHWKVEVVEVDRGHNQSGERENEIPAFHYVLLKLSKGFSCSFEEWGECRGVVWCSMV